MMKLLHIAVHLGGGAGKAIVGIARYHAEDSETKILLLETPEKTTHLTRAKEKEIPVLLNQNADEIQNLIEEADVVILNWWNHPLMVDFIYKFPKVAVRLVIWSHINGCTYPYLPYEFLKKFHAVFFTTPYSCQNSIWSVEQQKDILNRAKIIYGMGDFQPLHIVPKEEYKKQADFVVGYVGTLNYGKLHVDFIKYCEEASKYIENIKFVLVGDLSEEVAYDIKKSKIASKFIMAGHVTEVSTYYRSFDAFGYLLNNDNYATTENSLLEAMAYGLPIIVLDNDVEKNIIYHGKNGFLIHDKKEYAKILLNLSANIDRQRSIGIMAREYAISFYSEEQNALQFYKCCKELLLLNKEILNFMDLMKETPYDWFLYFAQEDGKIFRDYINSESEMNFMKVQLCKPIFKEQSKSSVVQFYKIFPENKELKKLAKVLQETVRRLS